MELHNTDLCRFVNFQFFDAFESEIAPRIDPCVAFLDSGLISYIWFGTPIYQIVLFPNETKIRSAIQSTTRCSSQSIRQFCSITIRKQQADQLASPTTCSVQCSEEHNLLNKTFRELQANNHWTFFNSSSFFVILQCYLFHHPPLSEEMIYLPHLLCSHLVESPLFLFYFCKTFGNNKQSNLITIPNSTT